MAGILSTQNVKAGYNDIIIIHDVSLEVARGEIVAILGPNGSGKSTFIKCILGFAKLFDGNVLYDGNVITGITADKAVSIGISYVPQINNVFPNLTISENLDIGAYHRSNKSEIKNSISEIFDMFPELVVKKKSLAGNLSGGERQMLAIARAIMAQPKVLLLDEPLASLSPKPIAVILSKLTSIKQNGIAIMMVEQNVREALSISDRGYVLVNGSCVMSGNSDSLFAEESSRQKFLGLEEKEFDRNKFRVHNDS